MTAPASGFPLHATDSAAALDVCRQGLAIAQASGNHFNESILALNLCRFEAKEAVTAEALDHLRKNGVEITFEEDRQGGVVNGPRAYFHDPDGTVLEFIDLTSYAGAL